MTSLKSFWGVSRPCKMQRSVPRIRKLFGVIVADRVAQMSALERDEDDEDDEDVDLDAEVDQAYEDGIKGTGTEKQDQSPPAGGGKTSAVDEVALVCGTSLKPPA